MIAADAEELVVKYLSQYFPNVGLDMPPLNPPLPFYLVNGLGGPVSWVDEYNTVSIHAFAGSRTAAAVAARALHDVMNPWVLSPKLSFALSTGPAFIDCMEIMEKPAYRPYEDPNLFRYCGRYRIVLRMNI